MGRTIDQDVHAAFVEFKAKEDDKCMSVQCIYCQQIRAKNTSRQKQHLLECPGLQNHPSAPRPQSSPGDAIGAGNGFGTPSISHSSTTPMNNGIAASSTPMQGISNGTAISQPAASTTPSQRHTPKPTKTPKLTPGSNLPAPPLDDVHAAFVEFRAKEEDKCLSVQCIYCNQIRAKNTSRQRQHLLECATYQNVMKESIPANNLLHRFDEGDIARSLQLPTPTLELDFRMSIKVNPKIGVGSGLLGHRDWVGVVGGQWAGRWGKGIVIPGGLDNQLVVKDYSTRSDAHYLLQTNDDPVAYIIAKTRGWRTGPKDVLERLNDPLVADTIPANHYKFRITVELETGDERYAFLNTCLWVGSGSRRVGEIIYDAYRVG
ncbi:uncharacterized protein Z519_02108 [Cladophialophora bantiana CBS 173.52]|uniref:Uncharacterized protein n=1 Tax=Cladophialophora bantiana (strain ATCC 10958 / CBS 173.52 / CDC B-1940 / NIH 8579) TaxID=1442370 RepID=A0A0D2GE99_CLAB1|nr:uncharacterized protein Z519_02108 [Cladophialophora bantiana CBS 173.52]KIW96717.1 hypothetical protein Z519_02108 [Cladophialophora bantiana CBS 173.52]